MNSLPKDAVQFEETLGEALREAQRQSGNFMPDVYMMTEETLEQVFETGFTRAFAYIKEQMHAGWSFEEIMGNLSDHVWADDGTDNIND